MANNLAACKLGTKVANAFEYHWSPNKPHVIAKNVPDVTWTSLRESFASKISRLVSSSNSFTQSNDPEMVRTVATTSRTTVCVQFCVVIVIGSIVTIDVKALALTATPFPFPFPLPPSTLLLLLFIQSDSFPREKQNDDDVDDDELLPLLPLLENDDGDDDDKTNKALRFPPKLSALTESMFLSHTHTCAFTSEEIFPKAVNLSLH